LGKQVNVEDSVLAFTGLLIRKQANEKGSLKEISGEILSELAANCGYDSTFKSMFYFNF
jgi:hypothetical protein